MFENPENVCCVDQFPELFGMGYYWIGIRANITSYTHTFIYFEFYLFTSSIMQLHEQIHSANVLKAQTLTLLIY